MAKLGRARVCVFQEFGCLQGFVCFVRRKYSATIANFSALYSPRGMSNNSVRRSARLQGESAEFAGIGFPLPVDLTIVRTTTTLFVGLLMDESSTHHVVGFQSTPSAPMVVASIAARCQIFRGGW